MGERESREAANTSQGQDLTLESGLADIFTNTQINTIGWVFLSVKRYWMPIRTNDIAFLLD